jgi:hypothetical protein
MPVCDIRAPLRANIVDKWMGEVRAEHMQNQTRGQRSIGRSAYVDVPVCDMKAPLCGKDVVEWV